MYRIYFIGNSIKKIWYDEIVYSDRQLPSIRMYKRGHRQIKSNWKLKVKLIYFKQLNNLIFQTNLLLTILFDYKSVLKLNLNSKKNEKSI